MDNTNNQKVFPEQKHKTRSKIFIVLSIIIFLLSVFIFIGPYIFPDFFRQLYNSQTADCTDCGFFIGFYLYIFLNIMSGLIILFLLIALIPGKQRKVGPVFLALMFGCLNSIICLSPQIYNIARSKTTSGKIEQQLPNVLHVEKRTLDNPLPVFHDGLLLANRDASYAREDESTKYYFTKYDQQTLGNLEPIEILANKPLFFSQDQQSIGTNNYINTEQTETVIELYRLGSREYWEISFSKNNPTIKELSSMFVGYSSDNIKVVFKVRGVACQMNKQCPDIDGEYSSLEYKDFDAGALFDTASGKFSEFTIPPSNNVTESYYNHNKDRSGYYLTEILGKKMTIEYQGKIYQRRFNYDHLEPESADSNSEWLYYTMNPIDNKGLEIESIQYLFKTNLKTKESILIVDPSNPLLPQGKSNSFGSAPFGPQALMNGNVTFIYSVDQNITGRYILNKDGQLLKLPDIPDSAGGGIIVQEY